VHTIEPISIGIISEDVIKSYTLYFNGKINYNIGDTWDRKTSTNYEELQAMAVEKNKVRKGWVIKENMTSHEYYAICKEFDLQEAWNNIKLRNSVLIPITEELARRELLSKKELAADSMGIEAPRITIWLGTPLFRDFKRLILKYGKTREQIANEIKDFYTDSINNETALITDIPEFYGYYSSYDWVVFCQLYGESSGLPAIFPLYCTDLKQTLREKWTPFSNDHVGLEDHPDVMRKETSYNSLQNAVWIKYLYKFLNKL
jgi:hypothetical protein